MKLIKSMRSLILNILPQAMMLIGLAGMVWMSAKNGFPFRSLLNFEKLHNIYEIIRKKAAERGLKFAEKSLRIAKIITLRIERFLSLRLEMLGERKKREDKTASSFWKDVRERKIMIRKPSASLQKFNLDQESFGGRSEDILSRFAKKNQEKNQKEEI